jgi:pilus assembly protein Flp/PilA
MARLIKRVLQDRSGATAIEYGLIAALVAVAIITGLGSLGTSLNSSVFGTAANVAAAK